MPRWLDKYVIAISIVLVVVALLVIAALVLLGPTISDIFATPPGTRYPAP